MSQKKWDSNDMPDQKGKVAIVTGTSSTSHKSGKIDFNDLDWKKRTYKKMRAYGDSKIAHILSHDTEIPRMLWEASEKLTGIEYKF